MGSPTGLASHPEWLTRTCCRYRERSRMKDLIRRSCIRKFFSVSSKASSFSCERNCFKGGDAGLSTSQTARCGFLLLTGWTAEGRGSDPKLTLPLWPGAELHGGKGCAGPADTSGEALQRLSAPHAQYLGCKACEMLEVAAHTVGFLDDRVEVEFGDLLHEAILIPFPVL